MGTLGGILRATKGADKFNVMRNVKNQGIDTQLQGLLGDFGTNKTQSQNALAKFTADWAKGATQAQNFADSDVGAINQYYDGSMASILSNLRGQRQRAVKDASDRAVAYATRGRNSNLIAGGGGGGSSYNTRLGLRQTGDIMTGAAVDDANQARADLGMMENARLGLLGRRGAIMDANAQRSLMPQQMQNQEIQRLIGLLGGLTNLDQANSFYGLQKQRTSLDKWADISDAIDQGVMNGASAFGSVMGGMMGMGGGAPAPQLGANNGSRGTGSVGIEGRFDIPGTSYGNW